MHIQYEKSQLKDLAEIMSLIKTAVLNMEQSGIYQWDEMYPSETDIKKDIDNNQLYIGKIDKK